jgi:tRNA U34 5-carboxymethylaminomethyl modifying GTPase MnmE/TrmE
VTNGKAEAAVTHISSGADNSEVWEESVKIAVLGAGNVGKALGQALARQRS